jgi:hypothetical protein
MLNNAGVPDPTPWQDMVEERQKGGDAPCTNPLEAG